MTHSELTLKKNNLSLIQQYITQAVSAEVQCNYFLNYSICVLRNMGRVCGSLLLTILNNAKRSKITLKTNWKANCMPGVQGFLPVRTNIIALHCQNISII